MSFVQFVRVLLPSFCLFYSFYPKALPSVPWYNEAFGNNDYYLDVYYDINPNGIFQKQGGLQKLRFFGYLVTGEDEERVVGVMYRFEKRCFYFFNSRQGRFVAELKPSHGGCEPALHFRIEHQGKIMAFGVLRGAFCR